MSPAAATGTGSTPGLLHGLAPSRWWGRLAGQPSGLEVVERELVRSGRGWQTFAVRTGFAMTLLMLFGAVWQVEIAGLGAGRVGAHLPSVGRRIFGEWKMLQLILLVLVTPVLVSQAITEEKNGGTLELLSLTRIGPRRILGGKILSRLLVVESLLLAGLPVLVLCLSLGGVEPVQVVNTFLQLNAMILSLTAFSAFASLYARSPVFPTLIAWFGCIPAWGLGGMPYNFLVGGSGPGLNSFDPVSMLKDGTGLQILGPPLAYGLLAAVALVLTGQVFAAMAGGSRYEDEELSVELWVLERTKKRLGLLAGLLLLGLPVLGFLRVGALRPPLSLPPELFFGCAWLWNLLFLVVAAAAFLLACRRGLRALGAGGLRRTGWRALLQDWTSAEVEVEEPAHGGDGDGAGVGSGRRSIPAGQPSSFLRRIRGNPVAWRETFTALHGRFGCWLGRFYIAALALLLLAQLLWDREDLVMLSFLASLGAFLGAAGLVVLVTVSSLVAEQRSGALALLCASRLGSVRILWGKLTGLLAHCGPLIAIALLLQLGSIWAFSDNSSSLAELPSAGIPALLLERWLATSLVEVGALAFVAMSCQWIALRARTEGRAWILCFLWTGSLAVVPAVITGLFDESSWVTSVLGLVNPIFVRGFWSGPAIHPTVWLTGAVWCLLSVALFAHNAWTLEAHARR